MLSPMPTRGHSDFWLLTPDFHIPARCKHCYAERMALRLQAMGQPNYANGFDLTLHENALELPLKCLELPLKWKKPQTIFVNSMSDLFHKKVPVEFILRTFDVMCRADWHRYQVLTKRSERLMELSPMLPWRQTLLSQKHLGFNGPAARNFWRWKPRILRLERPVNLRVNGSQVAWTCRSSSRLFTRRRTAELENNSALPRPGVPANTACHRKCRIDPL